MAVTRTTIGKIDEHDVYEFSLTNRIGIKVTVITYGATVTSGSHTTEMADLMRWHSRSIGWKTTLQVIHILVPLWEDTPIGFREPNLK